MYLSHSHFYLGYAVGCDEIRKYIDSKLHEMEEAMKSLQKTIDSSVQASRNPASSNKGPMLADYPSCGETSMEDDLESIFSSLCSTTASPAASFLSPTEEKFTRANSAPPTTTVGASLYPSHGYLPHPSSHLQLSQEQRFSFPHTQQLSGPLSCSPSTTHMPAFGQLIRNTPTQKLTHPTPQFVQPSFLQQTPKQQLLLPSYSPLLTVPHTIDARCDKSAFHQPLTSQRSTEQINWFNSVSPEEFMSADAVLARYQCFKNMRDVGHLAIQLAKRTYFGTSVMSHSTVSGRNNTTPLDRKKMKEMKAVLRSVFSSISDEEFERVWMNCCTSISHACKNLRN